MGTDFGNVARQFASAPFDETASSADLGGSKTGGRWRKHMQNSTAHGGHVFASNVPSSEFPPGLA